MKKSKVIVASFAALSLATVSGCVTDPNTGQQKVSRTAMGGVGGAVLGGLLGGVIGGKTGRIIGAGLGGVGGAVVGYQMDKQIKELKESTAGSGVDVTPTDDGSAILVNLPDGVTFDVGSYTIKPAFEEDSQLGLRDVPALYRPPPFFAGVLNDQIKQFQQAVLVREATFCLG